MITMAQGGPLARGTTAVPPALRRRIYANFVRCHPIHLRDVVRSGSRKRYSAARLWRYPVGYALQGPRGQEYHRIRGIGSIL